jgi:hypothetical protein
MFRSQTRSSGHPSPYFFFHTLGRHGALLEQWQAIKNAASDALIEAVVRSRIITPLAAITGLGTIVSVRSFLRQRFGPRRKNSIRTAYSTPEC